MTNLKIIREACIKANRTILELEPGCKVLWCGEIITFVGCDDMKYYFSAKRGDEIEVFSASFDPSKDKILGRDIRLADVLLAIIETSNHTLRDSVGLKILKQFKLFFPGIEPWSIGDLLLYLWNLDSDNLECQSGETLQFIADLLTPSQK